MSLNIAAQSSQNVKLVTKAYTWAKQADEQVHVPSLPVLQRTLPELDWTLTETARLVFDPMAQTILLTQPPKWLCLQPCSLLARFQTSPTASSFVEGNTPNQRNSELRVCTGSCPLAWEQPHPRRESSFSYTVVLVPWESSTFVSYKVINPGQAWIVDYCIIIECIVKRVIIEWIVRQVNFSLWML